MKNAWILLAAVMVLSGCASGIGAYDQATVKGVRIVDFGIYDRVDDAVLARRLSETTVVPAKIGTSFGFRFVTEGLPRGATARLIFRDTYPGLPDPSAKEPLTTGEYANVVEVGATDICAFTFENEWELVPGEWTFSIGRGNRLLAEKTFTVVR